MLRYSQDIDIEPIEVNKAMRIADLLKVFGDPGRVLISGFGRFCVKEKKERKGRNPQTGNGLMLDARRVVTFKCSRTLRENLNKKKKRRKS